MHSCSILVEITDGVRKAFHHDSPSVFPIASGSFGAKTLLPHQKVISVLTGCLASDEGAESKTVNVVFQNKQPNI